MCVCVALSFSPILWMIHNVSDLYTMQHYTETTLQGAGCSLQSEKSKVFSLSGIIT